MPTLQEVANRNAEARRGVSVYSPTRVVRPPGQRANAGTAGRILNSRQAGSPSWSGGGSTSFGTSTLPAYTPPEQPGQGRTALDDLLESLGPTQPPDQPEGPGGWRGTLGTVVNSVPGRAFFTALDALDRPRRAIAATVAEGLDLVGLNADSRTDGEASWSDWWNQFNDPTFGFGDIVASTGNKWLDRGIGLAGDLAMDPLNYLTGSGVIAGTGARARVGLAARAFGAGVAPDVAERVGRLGLQSLDNAERRAINLATGGSEQLLDRGYYFRLPFMDARRRVLGSGPIEQLVGGTFARARNAVTSTRPMSTVRYWRSERGLQDAIGKLLTGGGDISFGVAASLVNYRKGAGIAANRVNGTLAAEWERLVKQYGQQGLQDMVHEAETVGGTALNRYYDFAADLLEKEGLRRPSFPNYIPHVFTDDAIDWLRNTPEGRAFHNELFKEIDFNDLTPHMLQRKLVGAGADGKPRVYVLNGVRMEIKEGSIRELNEQFAKAMPNATFKLLDDDISNVSARYSKSVANSVGQAGGLLYLANQSRGLVRYADDDAVLKDVLDAAKTAELNVEAHKFITQKLSAARELVSALTKQRDEGITTLHGPVATYMGKLIDTMDSLTTQSRNELKDLLTAQTLLSAKRDALANEPLEYTENAAKLVAAADAAFEQLDEQYQAAAARLAAIEPAFRIAEQQWLAAGKAAREARVAGQAGIVPPPMSKVQKEYRKGVIDLSQLAIDRDAAATIAQRITAALRKERAIERNIDSDTFLARVGEDVLGLGEIEKPPVRYVDPETGDVQWVDEGTPIESVPIDPETKKPLIEYRRDMPGGAERATMEHRLDPRRSAGRTAESIYVAHNQRRAEAIAPHEANFPTLRTYQDRIEAQTGVVLAKRQEMFNAASLGARETQAAQVRLNELRQIERDLINEIEDVLGSPNKRGRLKELERQLAELRGVYNIDTTTGNAEYGAMFYQPYVGDQGNGPLGRALRAYAEAQRPLVEARQAYDEAVNRLNNLKRLQDAEAMKVIPGRALPARAVDEANFGARMREFDQRSNEVSRELYTQTDGRKQYLRTPNGKREARLHRERADVSEAMGDTDRRLEYWKNSDADGPWRTVSINERPDGTYEVVPRWARAEGDAEEAVIELSTKREWFTSHFIDPTANELNVVAADLARARDSLARAWSSKSIAKIQRQVDSLAAKHERLTTRLRRFRNFAHDKYDRRIAAHSTVSDLVARRNSLVVEGERITGELTGLGNRLDEFDANITRLRGERDQIFAERAAVVNERAVGVGAVPGQSLYRSRLQSIHASERNALAAVGDDVYGYKLNWEPVPTSPDLPGRANVWSSQERQMLQVAYDVVHAWDQLPADLRTAELKAHRDAAVRKIRELTSPDKVRGGETYPQQHLRNIIDNYDEDGLTAAYEQLQRDRIPFKPPSQRSRLGRALAKGSGAGDRSPAAVARRALKMFNKLYVDYGEKFVARGIIPVGELSYWRHKAIELQDVMTAFSTSVREGGGASPILMSKRDQLAQDLNRFSEVMFTLRAAHEEGGVIEPSSSLAAYIAADRLDKEAATVTTDLQRTLHALGRREMADADAKTAARHMAAVDKMDEAEAEWERLNDALSPETLGREQTPEEARKLKNARARYNRHRKAAENLEQSPMSAVLSDEVEHITYIVEQYISDISEKYSDLKLARSIVWNQGSPIRTAARLDVSINAAVADIERAANQIEEMRRLVQEAQAAGETTITYTPTHVSTDFMMTPQEVLDEIRGGTRDKIVARREAGLRKRAEQQIAAGDNTPIEWSRRVPNEAGRPETIPLYDAMTIVHKDEAALVGRRWTLDNNRAELASLRGDAPRWITHFDQILQDQVRPPRVEILRGELRDLEYEINRRFPPQITERERLDLQLRRDRLEMLSNPPMTQGEIEALQRKRDMYDEKWRNYQLQMGGEKAYVASLALQDDGRQLFTDIVTGARPVRQSDIDIITERFGNAEEAELSLLWVNTFNQLIDILKQRRLTEEQLGGMQSYLMAQRYPEIRAEYDASNAFEIERAEAEWVLAQLREVAGDSELNNRFAAMLEESIERTGWEETAEELQATAAREQIRAIGEEAYTAGERMRFFDKAGNELPQPGPQHAQRAGFNIGAIRNEVISSLIESSMQAKNTAMADATRIMRLLGFDNFIQSRRQIGTTMTGKAAVANTEGITRSERLSILGYSVSKQVYTDPEALRRFVTHMLHGMDYDYTPALRRSARNLSARLARINMMRRALGASLDESAERVTDPERFLGLLAKWREAPIDEPELGGEALDRITDFNTNVLTSMDQIYSDRISQLQGEFAEAVLTDDMETIQRLGPQIRELIQLAQRDSSTGLGPERPELTAALMTPAPGEDAVAQAAVDAMSQVPPNEDAINANSMLAAAQTDYDNATAALAAAELELAPAGPPNAPNPNAPTQARSMVELIEEEGYERAPGKQLTRADLLMEQQDLIAQRNALPRRSAERTAEQQREYKLISQQIAELNGRAWAGEPEWQVEAADAIYALETRGTPLPWDLATGEETNQETLANLRAEVERTRSALDAARSTADPAHLGPGDATAGELADTLPAGASSENQARRAELQAQVEAARAAGDENAARWAEQQMGWLDEPEEAVQPATISPVETEGVADAVTPPDVPAPPPKGIPQDIDQQMAEIAEEFKNHLSKYGDYANAPDEIKQRLAALSASARKLVDDRNNRRAADMSARQRVLDEIPELAKALQRAAQVHQDIPPSISADVWTVLRHGPSYRTFDPQIERKLKPKVKLYTGVSKNEPAVAMVGEVFPMTRSPRSALLRGNVTAGGERVLGAATEASLQAQLAASPRRIVQTARERLTTRLSEIKAQRMAAQAEYMNVVNANVRAAQEAGRPVLGPELPEMTLDELATTARGELDRITPEYQAAMAAEHQAKQAVEAARAKRSADIEQQARQAAQDERTRQLAELDMDLAKIRADVDAVQPGVADWEAMQKQVKSAIGAVTKDMKVKSRQVQDLLDLAGDINNLTTLDPTEANVISTLLQNALESQRKLDAAEQDLGALEARLKSFGKDPAKATVAGELMKKVALDGWEGIATKLLRDETATLSAAGKAAGLRANQSVVIAKELRDRLERVTRMMETPEAWKLVDKYTAFFKTYATARPGFHVRNALSAVFMNLVDGVRIRDMYDGMSAWRAFTKNPREFWESADQRARDAVTAVLASGAGGQFSERGLATAGSASSKAYRTIMNNWFTNKNRRAGTFVEGAARMGMALNSARRGQSLDAAVDRLTKYHFNYRELSSMDVTARRYIPFWTFMSRNLPLQLEQMWLRPQMYLRYQSLVRNFEETPDPLTPEYWLGQGAFTMDENAAERDAPWYLAPDLPHLRVHEPFEAMAGGDWGRALLSDLNPLGMAPVEAFAFNKKVYTGAPIEGDYIEPSNWMKPLLPLMAVLGGTAQGASGQAVVDDRYAHVARSLLPPLEILERLTTEAGTRQGRRDETLYRFLGAPVLQLTDTMRESTRKSQRFEERERRQTQAQLARM
ncbi:MAG TPA: hypothetical protein VFX15_00225 [Actinomycetes bacterium]|nr:hypothetical protein [Actinomycetes bacterium]